MKKKGGGHYEPWKLKEWNLQQYSLAKKKNENMKILTNWRIKDEKKIVRKNKF